MDDLISRQAAIDALRTCYDTETISMDNGDEYINYGDAVGEIEQLPPIQPSNNSENPNSSDTISRQAAINEIERAKVRVYHSIERAIGRSITEILDEVEKDVRGLPPSESKRGYWKYNAKIGTFKVWTCDQCGWNSEAEFNYCPNCGAKMEGEQDG